MLIVVCNAIFFSGAALGETENAGKEELELSEEEWEFVKRKREIIVGCPMGDCPLIFADEETGEIKGITIDILDMVSEMTGIMFRYQALPPGSMSYQELKRLRVDMVASVESNDINEEAPGIAMTEPYLQAEKVFVCKKGVLFEQDEDMVIAVASGSKTLERVIREKYPKFQVKFYNTVEDALSALLEGEADAVLQNQYSMERILSKPRYEDLQIVAAASIGDSHCLASLVEIDKDRQNVIPEDTALLLSVLNKGIANLDKSRVSFYIIKETAENTYKMTLGDVLYRRRYAVAAIIVSLCLIAVLLWRNNLLRKKRTAQLTMEQRAKELSVINKNMEEQQVLLKDALERAEAGSRAKSSFLFNMSHDIRTPMNAILGFAEIAHNNMDDREKLADSLEKIQESGKHLLMIINKVLDMSRIESGKVTLTQSICNLVEMIGKVRDLLQVELDKKKLAVLIDSSDVKNEWVYCDSLLVNQILFNLLNNAVKFSNVGAIITVSLCQNKSDMKEYAVYELHVKDTGIGMSPEFQAHIFEAFERERTSTISKTQGTGLGMAITKNLVDLMGGTIEVHSEVDKGTEFVLRFTFKIHKDEQQIEEADGDTEIPAVDFSGKRLLLVEDNELNREIAEEILGEDGFIIETAENGQEAVDMVRRSQLGYYDVVLMDIQMPVMDGYQATREIRRLEMKGLADIPIIAMTANAFDEDKKEALANGMNAHVGKPIDVDVLHETLGKVLRSRAL